MDSASHQNYLIKWANGLKVPVFSVDYRLAPKYPFPDCVNDCFQAYVWLLTQAETQLGLEIDKIVLAGDSAGGHLTMSVTLMCLLRGIRPPDGIMCLYPVLTVNLQTFYPSSLMMSDDEIISTGFISFCVACLLRKGGNPNKNPILSPLIAPDFLIKQLPPTHILVCEIDGLRD